jgi:hypothetical protein
MVERETCIIRAAAVVAVILAFGCRPCMDLSGVWLERYNDCFGSGNLLHVTQNGCSLAFEEAPDLKGRIKGDKVFIESPQGESCEGEVSLGYDGTFQEIRGRCMPDWCPWGYDRGLPTEWCPEGALLRSRYNAVQMEGVDMLFVIDNSGVMVAAQDRLAEAFPDMIGRIVEPITDPGTGEIVWSTPVDFHVGVISTDMGVAGYAVETCEESPAAGDDGVLQSTPRGAVCPATYDHCYLEVYVDTRYYAYTAAIEALASDFGCIESLGTDGCRFEQPLEAAHKALYEQSLPGAPNAGFLRPDTILAMIFITDDEDCSAADPTMFDVAGLPYSVDLRCYYNPTKLHMIDRYFNDYLALRGGIPEYEVPENLVLGFIVGVPPGETACSGSGETLGGCLDVPGMQEMIGPDGDRLEYACTYPPGCAPPSSAGPGDCDSAAFPGRRFVQLAQAIGSNAVVGSLCTGDFRPTLLAVAEKIRRAIIETASYSFDMRVDRPIEKDPSDPCRCTVPCSVHETLWNNGPCTATKIYVREDEDEAGGRHTVCEVPQVGFTLQGDCSADCNDAQVEIGASGSGWYYHGGGFYFLSGGLPEERSTLEIECCLK